MSEATSITIKRDVSAGEKTLYELKSVASDAETITIPTTQTEITTTSVVQIVGVNDVSNGTGGKVSTTNVTYSAGNRQFTFNKTGATDVDLRILFYLGD